MKASPVRRLAPIREKDTPTLLTSCRHIFFPGSLGFQWTVSSRKKPLFTAENPPVVGSEPIPVGRQMSPAVTQHLVRVHEYEGEQKKTQEQRVSQDSANLAIAEVTHMRYPNISNRAVVGGPITITSFLVFAKDYILMERRAARGDWRRCAPVGRDGCRRARSGDLADLRCGTSPAGRPAPRVPSRAGRTACRGRVSGPRRPRAPQRRGDWQDDRAARSRTPRRTYRTTITRPPRGW